MGSWKKYRNGCDDCERCEDDQTKPAEDKEVDLCRSGHGKVNLDENMKKSECEGWDHLEGLVVHG